MAKKDATALAATPENNNGTTLAISDSDAAALANFDDFGDFDGNDGLSEVDAEDFRLPVVVWNVKGKDEKTGRLRQIDQFYNTLTEEQTPELRCAFIHLHKSKSFVRFDNGKNENVVHCSSHDRVEGTMRTNHPDRANLLQGTVRACASCPDKEWAKNADNKNVRNCDDVYGVYAVMLDSELRPTDGFLIRFKRTGLPPFTSHLNKHHLNRRQLPNGKRGNMPLFAFAVNMTLEVSKNGNFATPVITRGQNLPRETIQLLAGQAKFFAELGSEATAAAEKAESRHEAGVDTNRGDAVSGADFVQ
jgi:hypothetical protein